MKKYVGILITTIIAIFFLVIVRNNGVFLFDGDQVETIVPFYQHINNLLKNGDLKFWDSSIGFGANVYSFFFNASIGSIFQYLYFLLSSYISIEHYFFLMDLIRFFLIGIFSFLWISHHSNSFTTRLIVSFTITFSGFMAYWIHFNVFLESYLWTVIILYLYEEVLKRRKIVLFIVCIFLSVISNMYGFYIFSWLLFVYFNFKYFKEHKEYSLKEYIGFFWLGFRFYIIGVLLASFIVLPNIAIILNSPRLDMNLSNASPINFSLRYLYQLFSSFYSPVVTDYNTNLFYTRGVDQSISMNYYYSFLITPYLLSLLPFIKSKDTSKYLIFYLIAFSANFIIPLRIMLSGNADVRWHSSIIFINSLLLVHILDNLQLIKKQHFILASVFNLLSIVLLYFYSTRHNLVNSAYVFNLRLVLVLGFIFFISYSYVFINRDKTISKIFLILIIILEAILSINSRMYHGKSAQYINHEHVNTKLMKNQTPFLEIIENDPDFYRIDGPVVYPNQPLAYAYPGFTFYMSVYNNESRDLLNNRFTPGWNSNFVFSKFLVKSLFGAKYYVADKEDEIPYGYTFLYESDNKNVYLNRNVTGLGFASNKRISYQEISNYNTIIQDLIMFQNIVTSDAQGNENLMIMPSLLGKSIQNGELINPKEEGYIFIDYSKTNPYSKCYVEWYMDDSVIFGKELEEYAYIAVRNRLDANRVYFYCKSLYNENDFTFYDAFFVSDSMIDQLYHNISQFDRFYDYQVTGLGYNAKIDVRQDQSTVFTNIAYDPGWVVSVNGAKVETEKVNFGFLGFKLQSGSYLITFEYFPPNLMLGIIISILTLVLSLFYLFRIRFIKK